MKWCRAARRPLLLDSLVLLRIQQITAGALQVQQGALYPALYRLEHQGLIESEWGTSENNRRAKYYRLTRAGRARLGQEVASWERLAAAIALTRGEASPLLPSIVAAILLVLGTVTLLSAAGIHALMSLTVTRRRREIGVRTALGAQPARLLAGIFSRAAWQVGLGGAVGAGLALALFARAGGLVQSLAWVAAVLLIMLLAGLVAAASPARRSLRAQPMEALREE